MMPIVAVLMILLAAFSGVEKFSYIWLFIFMIYGFFVSDKAGEDAEDLNHLAEHYYFVGYIATITGLGCVLYRLGNEPNLMKAPRDLLILGGTSVFCTIIGLIGMNLLRGKSFKIERKEREKYLLRDEARFEEYVKQIDHNFDNFSERMERLEATRMEQFSDLMNASDLAHKLKDLIGNIKTGSEALTHLQKVSSSATESANQMRMELGNISRNMGRLNRRIGDMTGDAEKIRVNWEKITLQSEQVKMLTDGLEKASLSMEPLSRCAQDTNHQVSQLGEVISETKMQTQTWQTQTSHAHQKMNDLLSALSNMCNRLQKAAGTEIDEFSESFKKASHKLQISVETIDDFVKKLGDSSGRAAGFSASLSGAIVHTNQFGKASEGFKMSFTKTAESIQKNIGSLNDQFDKLRKGVAESQTQAQTWQAQTDNANQRITHFCEKIHEACSKLETAADTATAFTNRLNERLSNQDFILNLGNIDRFIEGVQKVSNKMDPMGDSFDEVNVKLKEMINVLEGLKTEKKGWFRW